MFRTVICLVLLTFVSADASAQRAPIRKPVPPVEKPLRPPYRATPGQQTPRQTPAARPAPANPAGDSGPVRPQGFKPITLATAQKETERLKQAIEKLELRLNAKENEAVPAEPSGDAASDPNAEADAAAAKASAKIAKREEPGPAVNEGNDSDAAKVAPSSRKEGDTAPKTAAEKRTVAGVEIENRSLRRQVDALLVKVAEKEGTIPDRPAGSPKYDPHVIDSPTNADFCPGKTLEQLEDTMRFAGFPVGESEDGGVCYEWIFHVTKAERKAHATLRIWAIMKDGVAAETKQAAPGVAKEGPPPKFTPTR